MSYDTNRPKQLDSMRRKSQDQLFSRQPKLMKRLQSLLAKAEIIQNNTEPPLHSPTDPLREKLEEPKLSKNNKMKKLNKFDNNLRKNKMVFPKRIKKVSQVRQDVLWGIR